jgi:alpha-beta hydrolase superfamily lysophospholipase
MNYLYIPIIKTDDIYIIGHSKGGVSALLYCTQYDTKIKKRYVLGQVRLHRSWNSKFREQWRADGVQYIKNARTNQMMPLDLSVLTDLESNEEKYSLALRVKKIPYLIIQGTNDQAVKWKNLIY